jgi:hypothetical protein
LVGPSGFVNADSTQPDDRQAVFRPEFQASRLTSKNDCAELGLLVLKREVAMARGWFAIVRYFSGYPYERKFIFKQPFNVAIQFADVINVLSRRNGCGVGGFHQYQYRERESQINALPTINVR